MECQSFPTISSTSDQTLIPSSEQFFDWQGFQPFENTLSQWILRDLTRFCHNIIDKSLLGIVQIQVPGTLSSAPRAPRARSPTEYEKIPEQPVLVDGSMGQGNDFDIPNFEQHSPDRNPSAMASPATARTQEHIRSMTHCGTIKLGPNIL